MSQKNRHDFDYKSFFRNVFYYFDVTFRVIKNLFAIFLIVFTILAALVGGAALGYFASLVEDTEIPSQTEFVEQVEDYSVSSTMFYANENPISDLRSDLVRSPIPIDQVDQNVILGVVATEDENFFEHNGIVPKAVLRALAQQALGAEMITGGSSITQQIVKQQVLTNEVTHSRKANEILLALRLEDILSKEEILEIYFNVSPFGRNNQGENIAGIQEAANGIFGIEPDELNLPQAAFLAGLPQAPIAYTPYDQYGNIREDLSAGKERQVNVLFNMLRQGYITEEEFEEAEAYDLTSDFLSPEGQEEENDQSFVYDLVESEAQDLFLEKVINESEYSTEEIQADPNLLTEFEERADQEMRYGGYEIHSTIDRDIHNTMVQFAQENGAYMGYDRNYTETLEDGTQQTVTYPAQIGATLMDNDTGRILGFIGGRDYDISEFNIPFDTRRSSGSVLKPLAVYGPALAEHVITPATIIPDTEYSVPSYDGGQQVEHEITNYGETTNEWRPAREWLARSQNIPASKLYVDMLSNGVDPTPYLRSMGIGPEAISDQEILQASTALGGYQGGPTVTELTGAFSSIANNGTFNEPYVIDYIVDSNGDTVYQHNTEPNQVWNENANYLLIDMLRDVSHTEDGTASQIPDFLNMDLDLISKTGTSENYRDLWYVGATPDISLGFWGGYDNQNISMDYDYDTHPSVRTRNLWANLMNTLHANYPDLIGAGQQFQRPESIVEQEVLQSTGMESGDVTMPDGQTEQIDGETHTEIFDPENLPGTTVYDFPIAATDEELQEFWEAELSDSDDSDDNENDDEENNEDEQSIGDRIIDFFSSLGEDEEEENSEDSEEESDSENTSSE